MRTLDETPAASSERASLEPRRVQTIGIALVAAFLGLALWGLGRDPVVAQVGPPVAPHPLDLAGDQEVASPGSEPAEPSVQEHPLISGAVSPPREISSLLDARFKVRGEAATFQSLRSALSGPRSVAVVNLWATYCPPCREEFPGFKTLQRGWGEQVRFVPIQLGDDDPGDLVAVMPESTRSLVDTTSAGVVQSILVNSGLISKNPPIPITLLLDCKRRLRWIQIGEVKDMVAFDAEVAKLRGELGTGACFIPQTKDDVPQDLLRDKSAAPASQSRKPNGQCPPCGPRQRCVEAAGGNGICVTDPR